MSSTTGAGPVNGTSSQETSAQSDDATDLRYTETLAAQLIRHLGFDGVERTCRENHWSGVLNIVQAQRAASNH